MHPPTNMPAVFASVCDFIVDTRVVALLYAPPLAFACRCIFEILTPPRPGGRRSMLHINPLWADEAAQLVSALRTLATVCFWFLFVEQSGMPSGFAAAAVVLYWETICSIVQWTRDTFRCMGERVLGSGGDGVDIIDDDVQCTIKRPRVPSKESSTRDVSRGRTRGRSNKA